jgi:hypothetical protein
VPANDLVGQTDANVREVLGDKFPKQIYHSIICIGALIAHREPDHWAVDAIGAPHVGERTEKQLITSFCDKIAELSPRLVTFNGNSFDLPVLPYRAMIHGVSAPGLSAGGSGAVEACRSAEEGAGDRLLALQLFLRRKDFLNAHLWLGLCVRKVATGAPFRPPVSEGHFWCLVFDGGRGTRNEHSPRIAAQMRALLPSAWGGVWHKRTPAG